MKIYDSKEQKYYDYEIIKEVCFVDRSFIIIRKPKNEYYEVCISINGANYLINEDIVETESNYIYFTIFLLAYCELAELRVADLCDSRFYVDYIFEAFNYIDEYWNLNVEKIKYDYLLEEFIKLRKRDYGF